MLRILPYSHGGELNDNDEVRVKQIGLARRPFSKGSFPVKDGARWR